MRKLFYFYSVLFFLVTSSCQTSGKVKNESASPINNDSLPYIIKGYSNDTRLKEVSGMVKSLRFPGEFWVHNDSGDDPIIYRVNDSLQIIQEVVLEGAEHFDWEDISISVYQDEPFLFIGDIGDNMAVRDSVSIYLIKEPLSDVTSVEINRKIDLKYEDGARDAELLLFDPSTNELVIVTKRDIPSRIYSYDITNEEDKGNLIFEGELNLPEGSSLESKDLFRITAGDSSPKGELILKNYDGVYYYSPQVMLSIKDRLVTDSPVELKYKRELQGEAIAIDQNGFWVTSECADDGKQHIPQPLYFYVGFFPAYD